MARPPRHPYSKAYDSGMFFLHFPRLYYVLFQRLDRFQFYGTNMTRNICWTGLLPSTLSSTLFFTVLSSFIISVLLPLEILIHQLPNNA